MKAIIFDCDGVLVDSEVIYKASEREFLAKVGLLYETKEFFRRFMGGSEDRFFAEAEKDHMALHGTSLPPNFRESLLSYQRAEFERRLAAVPGMMDFAASIKGPKAVASSSGIDILNFKLNKTGYGNAFGNHVYSAQMVAHGKPEPDLFLYTAKNLNLPPEECGVVEDSSNGIIAALRAGMIAIGFAGGGHCPEGHDLVLKEAGAHYVANTVQELRQITDGLIKPAPHGPMSSA